MALRWAARRRGSPLHPRFVPFADVVPGRSTDRRSPLGELQWIFTSVTDAIAWDTLPRPVFLRLFRQEGFVASLARAYLLAERIMRSYGRTPASIPALPRTYDHPMWRHWDAAVDALLAQLPALQGFRPPDVARLDELNLAPDLSLLGTPGYELGFDEWHELASPTVAPEPEPNVVDPVATPAAAAAPGVEAPPVPPPLPAKPGRDAAPHAAVAGVALHAAGAGPLLPPAAAVPLPSKLKWKSPSLLSLSSGGAAPAGTGINFDPTRLAVPPAATATAEERVRLARARLVKLPTTTACGPAPSRALVGAAAYTPSTFFSDQLSAFDEWVSVAAGVEVDALATASLRGSLVAGIVAGHASAASMRAPTLGFNFNAPHGYAPSLATRPSVLLPVDASIIAAATAAYTSGRGTGAISRAAGGPMPHALAPVLRVSAPPQLPIVLQVRERSSRSQRVVWLHSPSTCAAPTRFCPLTRLRRRRC